MPNEKVDIREQILNDATSWMAELEFVNNKHFLNTVTLNIYKISKYIKDVEFVTDMNERKMLIYLQLSRWGNWFHKESVAQEVLDMMTTVLPSYSFRVIYNREYFEKAVDIAKRISIAGKNNEE